jgi:hypothetical protein
MVKMLEQLWSGFIGSVVAAIVGGLVALLVVRLTDRQHALEASKERQIAAISDLVVALDEMVRIVSESTSQEGIDPSVSRLQGASVRLQIELPKGPMRTELRRSTIFFHTFSERTSDSAAFGDAAGHFRFALMQWPSASIKEKEKIAQTLIDMRARYETAWREAGRRASLPDTGVHS